jgi:hypothetical protein
MNAHREPEAFRIWNNIRKVCHKEMLQRRQLRASGLPFYLFYKMPSSLLCMADFDDGQRSDYLSLSPQDHLLQLRDLVAVIRQIRRGPELQSAGSNQEDFAGGLAPYPPERPLHLS